MISLKVAVGIFAVIAALACIIHDNRVYAHKMMSDMGKAQAKPIDGGSVARSFKWIPK